MDMTATFEKLMEEQSLRFVRHRIAVTRRDESLVVRENIALAVEHITSGLRQTT